MADWHMDPVFRSIFRQAEQTDTRLGIRREEKHDDGRRKGHSDGETPDVQGFEEERPRVSVAALTAFLEGLLQTLQMRIPAQPTPDHIVPTVLPAREASSGAPASPVRDSAAARAAHAYKNVAEGRTSAGPAESSSSQDSAFTVAHQAEALSASDVRTIHFLLDTLKTLSVETLEIEKAPTFLQSLVNAVSRARTGDSE